MPNTKQQMSDLAKKMARQMAQEPMEILREAREQVVGTEAQKEQERPVNQSQNGSSNLSEYEQKRKVKDASLLRALENEAKDIRLQNVLKDLQARISEGEQISLEEYPELNMDQKQVLKSQMQAVRERETLSQKSEGIAQPSSKRSRRFGAPGRTQKAAAEREQTRVEKPVPPSG